jgi:hypothetical protein
MSASANPNIVEDGLVFMYDTANKKSYVGEPTINYIYHQNAVAQSSYTTNFATTDGTYSTKHPKAIRAYNAAGTQLSNYYNSGVTDAANTYHGHWQYDPILKKPVVVMNDVDGQWKAKSFGTGMSSWSSYGKGYGDTYTISWLQWVDHLSKNAKAGLYSRTTGGTNGFHDGQANSASAYNTKLRTWQRVYQTYTTSSVRDLDSTYLSIYMYGHYNVRATVKVADVQFTWGDHPAQFSAENERTATEGLIDRTGNSTIDLSNVSFDNNAQITFDGTDDYAEVADQDSLDLTTAMSFEFVVKADSSQSNLYPRLIDKTVYLIHLSSTSPFGIYQNITTSGGLRQTGVGSVVTSGSWTHIVCTYDGQYGKIYVDAELVKTRDFGSVLACNTNSSSLRIAGDGTTNRPLNGEMPISKIYNKVLTASEVLQNFNATRSRFGL